MKKNERQLLKTSGSAESDEYRNLIIIIIVIATVFSIFYFLTTMFSKKEHDNIFKNDLNPSEIQYDEIIIGNMFDKDGKYYVLLHDKDEQYLDVFKSYITSLKSNHKIYTVDLNNAFNKKYVSDEYSYEKDNFKVKGTVLLKIDNHEISEHFETTEGIIEKFKSLKNE